MKFVCEHCNSKYNIADEKVRNKVLKIRCKKCKKFIKIDGTKLLKSSSNVTPSVTPSVTPIPTKKKTEEPSKSIPSSASSVLEDRFAESFKSGKVGEEIQGTVGLFDAVKKSATRIDKDVVDIAVWFVAVKNSPIGPVSVRVVNTHYRSGEVKDESLVWKEGMPDWDRLRNCKELVGLLARLDLEESVDSEDVVGASQPRLDLFKKSAIAESVSPLKGHGLGVISERSDAVVDDQGKKDKFGDLISLVPESAFFGDDLSKNSTSAVQSLRSIHPVELPIQDRWIKIAAVGFFSLAVVVLFVMVFFGQGAVEVKTVIEFKEKVIEKVVYRDRPIDTSVKTETTAVIDEPKQVRERDANLKSGRRSKGKSSNKIDIASESVEERKKRLLAQMAMGGAKGGENLVGRTADKTSVAGAGSSGTALSQRQLSNVVNKNKGRLQICYEQSMKRGEAPDDRDVKVILKINVGGSGMVKKVVIGGAGAKYPQLQSCLNRSVKKWAFPSCSGESKVEFPFLFTPK